MAELSLVFCRGKAMDKQALKRYQSMNDAERQQVDEWVDGIESELLRNVITCRFGIRRGGKRQKWAQVAEELCYSEGNVKHCYYKWTKAQWGSKG